MSDGYAMTGKDIGLYLTIIRLYEQQPYMYDNRAHSVTGTDIRAGSCGYLLNQQTLDWRIPNPNWKSNSGKCSKLLPNEYGYQNIK